MKPYHFNYSPKIKYLIRKKKLKKTQSLKHKYPKNRIYIHKRYQNKTIEKNKVNNIHTYDYLLDEILDKDYEHIYYFYKIKHWYSNLKPTSKVLSVLIILIMITISIILYQIYDLYHSPSIQWNTEKIEYGDTSYIPYSIKNASVIEDETIDPFQIGKQNISISYMKDGEVIKESHDFIVEDTLKPQIECNEDVIVTTLGQDLDLEKLNISCNDPVDGPTSFWITKVNINKFGYQKGEIVTTDNHGNISKKSIDVLVKGFCSSETFDKYFQQKQDLKSKYEEKKKQEEEEKRRLQEEKERLELISRLGLNNLSESVLKWALEVHKINQEIWDTQYDALVLSVMQVESNGESCDLLQSSEANGGTAAGTGCGVYPNQQTALREGIEILKQSILQANVINSQDYERIAYGLQGYNFGPKYFSEYDHYTYDNSIEFSEKMKKELGWDTYGVPGYPKYVFSYLNPNYVFIDEEENIDDEENSDQDISDPIPPLVDENLNKIEME